jgi:hypothetical protein
MLSNGLTDAILALLHAVAASRHRRRGHRGGRRHHHRHSVLVPTPPQQPLPSVAPHRCALESPLSPSPDRLAYRPMEPLDPDTSPWGRRGRSCAVHGCTDRRALVIDPSGGGGGTRRRRRWALVTDPSCTTSIIVVASISWSRPDGLGYAAKTVESVWQPGASTVHPLHRLVWQRPRPWVLGLNDWAKPLSGDDGRRGVAPRIVEERVQFPLRKSTHCCFLFSLYFLFLVYSLNLV